MQKNKNMKVEYINTSDLIPYANNAKIHDEIQIEQIKQSIKSYGFNDPVAVWKNNEIIEGHGRVLAAKDLGIEQIPIIRLENLSDKQRREYMLVHNQLTMNTGFDAELLDAELQELDFDEFDYGFEQLNTELNNTSQELNIENYNDDKFECECPKCGFKFNRKK
jgi:ParB-like chromosome segregation protein Spo0J